MEGGGILFRTSHFRPSREGMLRPMTQDATHFAPTPERSLDLRRAFGRFGTGVTIVTTQTPLGPLGMTANSFSSISLDPALVLWSPAKNSQRHDAFITTEHFCIHILASDQIALARHFARHGTDFETVAWQEGRLGVPSLSGCLAEFYCKKFAVHPAGDHSVVLGEVTHVVEHNRNQPGLLFEQSAFGSFQPLDAEPQ
jgi:flavin reductase (DIM6/NTAB) family NADH-FMN oxidoreductase RutF